MRACFQYRVSGLLLATTVVCVWLGAEANHLRKKQRAIETIEELGGHIVYDYQWGDNGTWKPDAQPPGLSVLRELLGWSYAAEPVEVQLFKEAGTYPERFTDADARDLTALVELRWLVLTDTNLTDEGLRYFASLRRLERLDVERTKVTESGVSMLGAALPKAKVFF